MHLARVPRKQALSKSEFHERLRDWRGNDATVGPDGIQGRTAWICVHDDSRKFVLNADTKRTAVECYLDIVTRHGDDLRWKIVLSQRGKKTAVAYGPEECRAKGFFLYAVGTAG